MSEQAILDITCLQVGQWMIAIPSTEIITTIKPRITAITSTVNWFEGMCTYDDEILPVYNLSVMANKNTRTSKFTYLLIGQEDNPVAVIGVTRLVTKYVINDEPIIKFKSKGDIITKNVLGQLITKSGNWLILDVNSMLSDQAIKEIEIK